MVTVFVSSFNRLTTLERSLASYSHLTTPHRLVLVDNGTDHPACVALIDRLEAEGRVDRVYRLPGCDSYREVADNLNHAIRDQYERGCESEWFAVTDADICFDGTPADALDVYVRLAEEFDTAVGPHLRVDVPAGYPLRSRVLACETWMLYRKRMRWLDGIAFSDCQIDTTFHLFGRRRSFDRLHMGPLRVGPPYDAMHLDWHLDIFNPVAENAIYVGGERPIGSWGHTWIRDYWQWFQEFGPEGAWERLEGEPMNLGDLCNVAFLRSWALQYGVGVGADRERSEDWLRSAIPYPHPNYWPYEENWLRFVYDDDLSPLGWSGAEEVAE